MTDFFCCDKLEKSNVVGRPYNIILDDDLQHKKETLRYFEICDEYDCEKIDYCPFCGFKLSMIE